MQKEAIKLETDIQNEEKKLNEHQEKQRTIDELVFKVNPQLRKIKVDKISDAAATDFKEVIKAVKLRCAKEECLKFCIDKLKEHKLKFMSGE